MKGRNMAGRICLWYILISVASQVGNTNGVLFTPECGGVGEMQYSIKNTVRQPTFFHTVTMCVMGHNDTVVTKYMERACDENKHDFKNFSMTYFPGVGFYISAVNGVEETSGETYWELIEHSNGKQYEVGAAVYIPQPGDHVAWNLTIITPPTVSPLRGSTKP